MDTTERRERITAEIVARTGIDKAMIERLVHSFHARIREDALMAPVFEARGISICSGCAPSGRPSP